MKFEKMMTLDEAIAHAKEVADHKCDECGKEHVKLAEWLTELQGFKDETPITTEFLNKNFSFVDSDDSDGIWAALYDKDPYYAKIQIDTDCHHEGFKIICDKGVYYAETLGQLRMFLTLCDLGDFIKQLKSKEV